MPSTTELRDELDNNCETIRAELELIINKVDKPEKPLTHNDIRIIHKRLEIIKISTELSLYMAEQHIGE